MGNITEEMARSTYERYVEEGLKMFPPFKGFGIRYIQFAINEPEMYRLLFMKNSDTSYLDSLESQWQWKKVIPYVQKSLELNEKDAEWLVKNSIFYAHGIAMICINHSGMMMEEEVIANFGAICRGMIMQLKAPKDERIRMIPKEGGQEPGVIAEYIKGKKNAIIGYGPKKEMFQIRLDAILYFEAVGENVFAYTKANVYEIKQRLYQVEESTKSFGFIRASKALVVNISKIASIESDTGGRGQLHMLNGETVIASRTYYRDVLEKVKDPIG